MIGHVEGRPPRIGFPGPKVPFGTLPNLGFFDEDSSSDEAETEISEEAAAGRPWWETVVAEPWRGAVLAGN